MSGRFWAIEYTRLGIFQQTCDVKTCNMAKYGGRFRLALSQLGIQRSVVVQFHFLMGLGTFSLRPCLAIECTVPYTSPGFEIIWKCEKGLVTFEDARNTLASLYDTDPNFRYHTNPGGKSYIEVCSPIFIFKCVNNLYRSFYGCRGGITPE